MRNNSKGNLKHNPFESAFNNCFFNLRGQLCCNLDSSASKAAVAIREQREQAAEQAAEQARQQAERELYRVFLIDEQAKLKHYEIELIRVYKEAEELRARGSVHGVASAYREAASIKRLVVESKAKISSYRRLASGN
jgi:FKBP-type peptidyl-prolyl cis-trans isomerase (trigger factor)